MNRWQPVCPADLFSAVSKRIHRRSQGRRHRVDYF